MFDILKAPLAFPRRTGPKPPLSRPNVPLMFGKPALTEFPTSEVVVVPSRNLWWRFGRLNVVDPSPAPYLVPMTENRFA